MAQNIGRRIAAKQEISGHDESQEVKPKASKIKVRYAETKQVRDMRENFEKEEKRAMRSSRAYRYSN